MNLLEMDQVRKQMPQFKLDIARMEVKEGELAVVLGGAKSGKSTLIKLLLNMLFADFGTIRVCGLDSVKDSEAVKERLGVVLRRPGLLYSASLRQLKNMARPFFNNWDESLYRQYLRHFELNEEALYGRVGNDAKKQFVLALALAHRPDLLLLDEPFLHISAPVRERIAQTLWQEQRERGLGIILTSASPEEAARIAETLHIFSQGSLLLSLPMCELPELTAELDWQSLKQRSRKPELARRIAQTEALFAHYTKEGGRPS